MRIGLMMGPERGRYRSKVARLQADAQWAEEAGLSTVWIPQIPDEFDALTAATVVGAATSRIEIGTAVVPVQPRHPVALAQQALSVQAVCEGRLALGLGVSHHWIIDEMMGLPYEQPVATMRAYLDVLDQALGAPGPVDVENDFFRVHNPLDITDVAPTPVLLAALGPLMLRLCGERTDGTILWMADERAIGSPHRADPHRAAEAANRPPRASWRDSRLCLSAIKRSRSPWPAPTAYWPRPRYRRTTRSCWTMGTRETVGDILVAGSESTILKRLHSLRRCRRHRHFDEGGADRRVP